MCYVRIKGNNKGAKKWTLFAAKSRLQQERPRPLDVFTSLTKVLRTKVQICSIWSTKKETFQPYSFEFTRPYRQIQRGKQWKNLVVMLLYIFLPSNSTMGSNASRKKWIQRGLGQGKLIDNCIYIKAKVCVSILQILEKHVQNHKIFSWQGITVHVWKKGVF